MQKINENEINWINDGDDQDALTLNRPVKELLQKLGNQATSNIVQGTGNNPDQMISQKTLTELLTGWGSQNSPPPSSTDEMINGIYFLSSGMVQEFGIGGGGDGQLLVLGKQTDIPGSQSGEVQQIAFVNGKIYFRYSDSADDDGKPKWSQFDNFVLQSDMAKSIMPIGQTYIQFPGQTAPNTLFGGTWNQLFDNEGVFFRTPGGEQSNFGSGIQDYAQQNMTGDVGWGEKAGIGYTPTPTGVFYLDNKNNQIGNRSQDYDNQHIHMDASRQIKTANEVRPSNRTVRVWVRTA